MRTNWFSCKYLMGIMLICNVEANAQATFTVSPEKAEITVKRAKTEQLIKFIIKTPIVSNSASYTLDINVEVDRSETTLNDNSYNIDFIPKTHTDSQSSGEMTGYFTLLPDSIPDRERQVKLNITVKSGTLDMSASNANTKGITFKIPSIEKPQNDTLKDYYYLGYVGTNFDLVDGVKAKNLFFATNMFVPNESESNGFKSGFFVSLYGNRTVSSTDSINNVQRTSKIRRETDTTAVYYYERASRVSTYYSDNLGAYFSPVINLCGLSKKVNRVQLYYAPSFEFIWRRTHIETKYTARVPSDTISKPEQLVVGEVIAPDQFMINYNQYNFNVGLLGAFIRHENKDISIRLYFAIGKSFTYTPPINGNSTLAFELPYQKQNDYFFSGRLWITEPVSGLTLQAEISNNYNNPKPYYGVTLSKAIKFKNLGGIFSPITAR